MLARLPKFACSVACILACVTWLNACAVLSPGPRTLSITQERLLALIAGQFPFKSRLFDALDVNVSSPKLSFDTESNRLNTALDLNILGAGVLGQLARREFKGNMDLSYGLRFEPSDNSVRMADVRVNKLAVDGLAAAWQRPVDRLGSALAEQLLKDFTLYTLKPQDLATAKGWGYKPSRMDLTGSGLVITLEPVAR
jgi:hypothetical protein